jgi:DNA-binding PadR family transcriptional regulator
MKPWTTYELAQHMDRSLGRMWPRAVSKVYEEPKRLARLGLATARREQQGRRARTVYSITPKGRHALRAWLATPPSGRPLLEFEALMHVFFGENGSKADLLATLASVIAWSEADREEHITVAREYAAGGGAFPQRAAQVALTGKFVFEFSDMVGRWARWAYGIVEGWPDDPRQAKPERSVFEGIASLGSGPPATRPRRPRASTPVSLPSPRSSGPPGPSPAGRSGTRGKARNRVSSSLPL